MTEHTAIFNDLPDAAAAHRFLDQFSERHPLQYKQLKIDPSLLSDVLSLVSFSPLFAATILNEPEIIKWLKRKRGDNIVRDKAELLESLARFSLTNSGIEPNVLISRFRRRELMRIFLRDIRNLAAIAEITEEISNLADAILEHALRLAMQSLDNRFGSPLQTDENGREFPAEFCIVSLGKLGSKELNYASDIDLIFLYSSEGLTSGIGKSGKITNTEYYIKLVQTIVKLISGQSGEGAAYRVDLRLRPYGKVGRLALSVKDTVTYYQNHAASWEKQVLIRSRASAGKKTLFRQFYKTLENDIFSKDLSVKDALAGVRSSKQKIDIENITAKHLNVKLSKGGIREIEFIAQALQLAYGGSDRWLRSPHTLISLSRLADRKLISENELSRLSEAYKFLRHLEHILQMEHGLQTHSLPSEEDKLHLVAVKMGFDIAKDFTDEVSQQMKAVHAVFQRVFDYSHSTDPIEKPLLFPELKPYDFISSKNELIDNRSDINHSYEPLNTESIEIFDHNIIRKLSYAENLSYIRKIWTNEYNKIRSADLAGKLTIEESKHWQTRLAIASISAADQIVQRQLETKYKFNIAEFPFAIMALGKLSGAGIDHGSDLDLIMVFDSSISHKLLPPGVSPQEFFSNAANIFVNALSSLTKDGSLYRVDLRLRPYGTAGESAISHSSFIDYMNKAAIWELLAYLKIKGISGDINLAFKTENEIRKLIHLKASEINAIQLAEETCRIRKSLENTQTAGIRPNEIDIKYGAGGMLDIYFAVRFLQLRDNVPDRPNSSSTVDILKRLKDKGSIDDNTFQILTDSYGFLSRLDHAMRLMIGRTTKLPTANKAKIKLITEYLALDSQSRFIDDLKSNMEAVRSTFIKVLELDFNGLLSEKIL